MIIRQKINLCLIFVAALGASCTLVDDGPPKKSRPSGLIATPASYYSTPKARYLGTKYSTNLDRLTERIVRNPKTAQLQFANNISSVGGIGFFTHSATESPDERYLEVVVATPETFETKGDYNERVHQLFSRYGAELLGILAGDGEIFQDRELRGYGLNLMWRNVLSEAPANRVSLARAIIYFHKEKVANFLRQGLNQNELLHDAVIFAVEDNGPLELVSYQARETKPDFRPPIREDNLTAGPAKSTPPTPSPSVPSRRDAARTETVKKGPPTAQERAAAAPLEKAAPKAPGSGSALASRSDEGKTDALTKPVASTNEGAAAKPASGSRVPATPTVSPPTIDKADPESAAELLNDSGTLGAAARFPGKSVGDAPPASIEPTGQVGELAAEKSLKSRPEPATAMAKKPASTTAAEKPEVKVIKEASARKTAEPSSTKSNPDKVEPRLSAEVAPRETARGPAPTGGNEPATPPSTVKREDRRPPIESAPQRVSPVQPPAEKAIDVVAKPALPPETKTSAMRAPEKPPAGPAAIAKAAETKAAAPVAKVEQEKERQTKDVPAAVREPVVARNLSPVPEKTVKALSSPPVIEPVKSSAQAAKVPDPAVAPVPPRPLAESALGREDATPSSKLSVAKSETPAPTKPAPTLPSAGEEKSKETPAVEQLALLRKPEPVVVEKKPLARPLPKPLEGFVIQIAFNDKQKAQSWAEKMERRGYAVSITEAGSDGALRLRLGNFALRDDAERLLRSFKQEGLSGIVINLPQAFRPVARSSVP